MNRDASKCGMLNRESRLSPVGGFYLNPGAPGLGSE